MHTHAARFLWSKLLALVVVTGLAALLWLSPRLTSATVQAQAGPPVTCQEVRDSGLIVSVTDRELTGEDETRFCLVARPEEDTFIGYVANVTTAEAYRAAKVRYAEAMSAANIDVCRVGAWRPLNREGDPEIPLTASDRYDVPAVCTPRVVARDPDAAGWIEDVTALLTPLAEKSASGLGFTPHRPLTVDLYVRPTALMTALRMARPELGQDAALLAVHEARSMTVLSPSRGTFILLNLAPGAGPDVIRRRLAHEYTHYMQAAATGTLDALPMWFLEGQAEYQMERLAGVDWDRRADAARRERAGTAPSLTELVTHEQWTVAEALGGNAVYSRGYSAVAYLADRWGYEATTRLLQAGSAGDRGRFDRTLTEITGLDLAGFDQAVSEWLRSLRSRVTFVNDSPLALRLALSDGRTVELPPCTSCSFHRAADTCRTENRPSATSELAPGEHSVLRIVPADRIHFPDKRIPFTLDPGATQTVCLDLSTT